jgi:hypothetical protein
MPAAVHETPPALALTSHTRQSFAPSCYCRSALAVTHSCTPNRHLAQNDAERRKIQKVYAKDEVVEASIGVSPGSAKGLTSAAPPRRETSTPADILNRTGYKMCAHPQSPRRSTSRRRVNDSPVQTRSTKYDYFAAPYLVSYWHIASFRYGAAIRSLSKPGGHACAPRSQNWIREYVNMRPQPPAIVAEPGSNKHLQGSDLGI